MSTPAIVPMFAPDGTVRQVPSDQVDAATKAGGELAHQMKAPDGSIRYVPHSQFGAALQAGGVPVEALSPQQSLQKNIATLRASTESYPAQEQRENIQKYTDAYGSVLGRFIGNVASTVSPSQSYERGIAQGKSPIQQQIENLNNQNPLTVARTVGDVAKQAVGGDISGAAGRVAGIAGQIALLKKVGDTVRQAPAPLEPAQVASSVTNAINPATSEMAAMRAQIQQHMPALMNEARLTNTPITNRQSLAAVAQSAAERAHAQFQSVVDPVANEAVTNVPSGFQGKTLPYGEAGRYTTVGNMLSRLKEINATLNPKYAKGGQAAQMAVNAESAADMTREAAAIRSTLYDEISKRTGAPVEGIANLYQRAGALSDFADSVRYYTDEAQRSVNAEANKPLTVNPFSKDAARQFVLDPAANKLVNGLRGVPADKAIKKAFSR